MIYTHGTRTLPTYLVHGLCLGSHARGCGVACAARARRLAAQALLLICWPGRLPVTVDSQKPHRSSAASHPLPNLVIPLLPWQLISLPLSVSCNLFDFISLKLSLSLSLLLFFLPFLLPLSIFLYKHPVHAEDYKQYFARTALMYGINKQIDDRKSLLIVEPGKGETSPYTN